MPDGFGRLARQALRNQELMNVRGEAALIEALKQHRLERLRTGGCEPDASDEAGLLALVSAKLQAIDRAIKIEQATADRITKPEVRRILDSVVESIRRHVSDTETLRAIRTDIKRAAQHGGILDAEASE